MNLCKISSLNLSILSKAFIGCIMITVTEFSAGILLNKILKLNVWDYSSTPFNLLGQICLPYCIAWFILSYILMLLIDKYPAK